jgi:hypothetical protein
MAKPDLIIDGKLNPEIVERALVYARGLFSDPDFIPLSDELRQKICYPNQGYVANKDIGRVAVLVAWQATPDHDWGLNKHGLEQLYGAQGQQKVVGIVLLSANYNEVINVAPVQTVILNLQNIPPRGGPYGPFWWVAKDFRFAPSRGAAGGPHIVDPNEAF